jgi:hypothetical protein
MAFKMKYSGGTPFHFHGGDPAEHDKIDPKETKFVNTPEGKIAVERQTTIKGKPVEIIAKPGTPEYDKWKAAVDKDPTIEDKYKDRVITEKRDVNVNMRSTPGVFKKGKFYGLTLEQNLPDEMPMENINNIFKKAYERNKDYPIVKEDIKRTFDLYLKKSGYKRKPKVETKTNIGDWRETD